MYTFFYLSSEEKINFLSKIFFLICKMYTFDQHFWLEITNT